MSANFQPARSGGTLSVFRKNSSKVRFLGPRSRPKLADRLARGFLEFRASPLKATCH
jgi:hypothetical protein